MFLLPITQDMLIEGPETISKSNEGSNKETKLNFYDYIYVMNGNELLKLKIELDHMDVVNALEQYIDTKKTFDNDILSEEEAKKTNIPLKFLYYLGKYRLENSLFKTKNYLAPKQSYLLDVITDKYNNGIVDSTDLYNLGCIMEDAIIDEEADIKEIINNLFKFANIELADRFEIDKEELKVTIKNIKILLKDNKESQTVLNKLRWILEKTKKNKEVIYNLGLQDKINSVINKEKQKVK